MDLVRSILVMFSGPAAVDWSIDRAGTGTVISVSFERDGNCLVQNRQRARPVNRCIGWLRMYGWVRILRLRGEQRITSMIAKTLATLGKLTKSLMFS